MSPPTQAALIKRSPLRWNPLTNTRESIVSRMEQRVQPRLAQLRAPLYRNSIYLFGGTFISAGFNLIFWFVGARTTSAADVGIAQASIGSALLLILLADLGLATALPYYAAKESSPSEYVNTSIAAGWLFSSISVIIFWIGLPIFAPSLLILRFDPWMLAFFFLFTTFNFVIGLQDAAMLSQRNGKYVFWRTLAANLPSTLLLILLLFIEHSYRTMFVAFVLPNIVVGILVGWRVLPRFFKGYRFLGRPDSATILKMTRFGLFNYVNNILWGAGTLLLPLIVSNSLTPAVTGYFLINLTLLNLVLAVPKTVSNSMFVEGARHRENLASIALRSLMFMLLLVSPLILGISLLGGIVTNLFGANYVMMPTLRLMMLTVLPFTLTSVLMNFFRLLHKYKVSLSFSALVTASVLLFTNLLGRAGGAEGIALGLLVGYSFASLFGALLIAQLFLKKRNRAEIAASGSPIATARERALLDLLNADGDWVRHAELAVALNEPRLTYKDRMALEKMAVKGLIEIRQRSTVEKRIVYEYRVKT